MPWDPLTMRLTELPRLELLSAPPMFVHISKSALPTPKSPSTIMGSFSRLIDGALHHAIPPDLQASHQAL